MRFEAIRNNHFPSYRRIRPNPRCEVKSGVCVVNLLILDWKDLPYQTSCQRNIVCVMTFPCAFPLTGLFTGSWRHPVLQESLHRSAITSLDLSPWSIPPYKSVASQKAKSAQRRAATKQIGVKNATRRHFSFQLQKRAARLTTKRACNNPSLITPSSASASK